jgi:hypothetical protein
MREFNVEKDWRTECGLRAAVIKHNSYLTHRCGYVEVPQDHGLYNISYEEIFEYVDVHGGLTFSGSIPFEDSYWFGYDCAHSFDLATNVKERSLDYCINECEILAKQLHETSLSLFYLWKKSGKLSVEQHNKMLSWGIQNSKDKFVLDYLAEIKKA